MTAIRSTPLQSSVPSTLRRRTLGALLGGALSLGLALGAAAPSTAAADEIRVVTSGGFSAAYDQLIPLYEQATGHKVVTSRGASMGNAQDSIPSRLARGEQFDVVILADSALDNLAAQGKVEAGSRVDLARSMIGMSVRKGTPKPDISTVDALRQTLLDAKSVAYSASASGTALASPARVKPLIPTVMPSRIRVAASSALMTLLCRDDKRIRSEYI